MTQQCRICRHDVDADKVQQLLKESEGFIFPNVSDRPWGERFVVCQGCIKAVIDGTLTEKFVASYVAMGVDRT